MALVGLSACVWGLREPRGVFRQDSRGTVRVGYIFACCVAPNCFCIVYCFFSCTVVGVFPDALHVCFYFRLCRDRTQLHV